MDRLIRQITDQLVARLPENKNYYRIQNLNAYGFPSFLIRRIRVELQWNLDESMMLPKTDWANTQSDAVQHSWKQFLNAIHAEVQLPASYARAVIETAVADVVEILVQPRKRIPEILFGGEDVLTAEELEERTELLVVYPHFAGVLQAYMERKSLEEMDRARCQKIVKQVDDKITSQYTPLQWAQMLDPLFRLAGTEIDTNIFRQFFEDKNQPRVARTFDLRNDSISRATFIEILSSPDMLNYKGNKPDQSQLFKGDVGPEDEKKAFSDREKTVHDPFVPSGQDDASITEEEDNVQDSSENDARTFFEEPEQVSEDTGTEEKGNPEPQISEDKVEDSKDLGKPVLDHVDEVEEENDEGEVASLNDIFVDANDDENELEEESVPAREADNGEGAIWQRFLGSEEKETDFEQEPDYIDEPIIDLRDDNPLRKEKETLEHLLEGERSYYVEQLFGGSDEAYEEALRNVAKKDGWKSASKEIQNNIFKRNMIDIYSEPAVDFTDRLQSYFLDKKNNQ